MVEMAHRRVQPEHDAHREASGHGQRAASVTCEISLAALATAVGCARLFIRSTLQALGLDHLAEDAEVVASELVTNAVQATGITHSSPRWSELHNLALIRLRLVVMGDGLIIEVWDRDAAPPKPRQETALDAEGGRGLLIVESLSRRWNLHCPTEGGKWVWAELEISPEFGPLPRRDRSQAPPPVGSSRASGDPAVLRRVRDGLKRL
jgi:anti-sigma regulatory factor (Ser/Thr protein kinase)